MHIHDERISAHSHATGIGTERAIQPSNTNDHLDRDLRTRQIERSLCCVRKIIRSIAVASLHCDLSPRSAASFSANLQIRRIVNTTRRFVNTGSS